MPETGDAIDLAFIDERLTISEKSAGISAPDASIWWGKVMSAKLPIYRHGRKWMVDYRRLGKAFFPPGCASGRKLYATRLEAEGAAALALGDAEASLHADLDFTPAMRAAAIDAFKELPGYEPGDLVLAAREYAERHRPGAGRRTVSELLPELLASQRGAGNGPITLRNYEQHLGRFAADFGARDVSTIEAVELERWLDGKKIGGEHRKNYRRYLGRLFRFAVERNYTRHNPAAAVPKVRIMRKLPGILTSAQVQRLLDAAAEFAGGAMLPYFALCAMAGLRPSEARRLEWPAIALDKGEVYLSPAVVRKTGHDRFVTLAPNLVEWLALVPPSARRGRIVWTRRLYDGVRRKAGADIRAAMLKTKDVLRHACASHLYAKTKSVDLVTANLGHDLRVFLKHYRAAVSEEEGRAYFEVRPGAARADVISLSEQSSG